MSEGRVLLEARGWPAHVYCMCDTREGEDIIHTHSLRKWSEYGRDTLCVYKRGRHGSPISVCVPEVEAWA